MKRLFLVTLLVTLALLGARIAAQDAKPTVTPKPTSARTVAPTPTPVPGAWLMERVYPLPMQAMLLPRYPLDFGKPIETIKAGTYEKPTPIPAGVLLHVKEVRSDRSGNFYFVELAAVGSDDSGTTPTMGWIDGQQVDPLRIAPMPTPEVKVPRGDHPTPTPAISWGSLQFVDEYGRPRMMLMGPKLDPNAPSAAMQGAYPGPTPRPAPRRETGYNSGASRRSTRSIVR